MGNNSKLELERKKLLISRLKDTTPDPGVKAKSIINLEVENNHSEHLKEKYRVIDPNILRKRKYHLETEFTYELSIDNNKKIDTFIQFCYQ